MSLVDLAPTLAGLLGHRLPAAARSTAATSPKTLLAGGEPAAGEVYAETPLPGDLRLEPARRPARGATSSTSRRSRPELYDLRRDPGRDGEPAGGEPQAPEARGFAAAPRRDRGERRDRGAPPRGGRRDPRPAGEPRLRRRQRAGGAGGPGEAAPAALDPKTMVDLFQRFEQANARLTSGDSQAAAERARGAGGRRSRQPRLPRQAGARPGASAGRLAKALPLYRQAAGAAPQDPEAWYNLAVGAPGGRPARRGAAGDRARPAARRRPARRRTTPSASSSWGEGNLERARREFADRRRHRSARRRARSTTSATCCGRSTSWTRRRAAYQRAAALAPRYAEPLNGLGTLEVERDRPRQALPYFERALALAPGYHEVRLNRAIAHDLAGDAGAAAERLPGFPRRDGGRSEVRRTAPCRAAAPRPAGKPDAARERRRLRGGDRSVQAVPLPSVRAFTCDRRYRFMLYVIITIQRRRVMNRRTTSTIRRLAVAVLLALALAASPCCRPPAPRPGAQPRRPGHGQERRARCRASPSPPPDTDTGFNRRPSPSADGTYRLPVAAGRHLHRQRRARRLRHGHRRERAAQRRHRAQAQRRPEAGDGRRRRSPSPPRRRWSQTTPPIGAVVSQQRAREPAAQRPPVREPRRRSRPARRSRVQHRPDQARPAHHRPQRRHRPQRQLPRRRRRQHRRHHRRRAAELQHRERCRSSRSRRSSTRPSTAARPAAC